MEHKFKIPKRAFTLAEVLITLGIIGVVAALTIPTLMANHRKSVVETRLAKFYSTINQAITRAELDYGDKIEWDVLTSNKVDADGNQVSTSNALEWFNNYLRPYLQYTEYRTDIQNSSGTGDDKVVVYFSDGSLVLISGASFVFYPYAKDYELLSLEDGTTSRDKKLCGTKYFTFFFNPWSNSTTNTYHYKKGVEPYKHGWNGTEENLRNHGAYGCNRNASNESAYCTALIQMNGWKIPKDYPLGF